MGIEHKREEKWKEKIDATLKGKRKRVAASYGLLNMFRVSHILSELGYNLF